jgi:hypothetical protein
MSLPLHTRFILWRGDIWDYWTREYLTEFVLGWKPTLDYLHMVKAEEMSATDFHLGMLAKREVELYLDCWGCLDAPLP